jgi:putative membrane-bound dehydrogenase-like protein
MKFWRLSLSILLLLPAFCSVISAADPPKPLRILLVVGGCCHDYEIQKRIIKKGLEARAHVEVEVVHQGGSATNSKIPLYEKEDWSKGFDLVIHNECFADVKEPDWTQRVLKPHQEGLPAVVIHCAMHCYRDGTDNWFEFCGVTSRGHGDNYPHEVFNNDLEHSVMKGFGSAWANPAGELYFIEKLWPKAHALASAKSRDDGKEHACVWTNEYGANKTRVFGTTLGHHNVTFEDPKFLDLLTRGSLWAMNKLEDQYLKPVEPTRVPVNLALKKPVTAKSSQDGHPPAHLTDGDAGTRWCANGPQLNEWIQVDLDKPTKVSGCQIKWESSDIAYRYLVEGSLDGKEWKTLVDRRDTKLVLDEEKFEPQEVRYVRLTGVGAREGAWISVFEFNIFGDETILLDPQSAMRHAEQEYLADLKAPPGFDVSLFAAPPAVQYPVFVAAAEDGTVYVSVDKNGSIDRAKNRGAIFRLRDLDGDGRADEVKKFVANVDSPRGLVWDRDRLYVMHPPHLSAFIDHDGDGISDEQKILVKNLAFGFKDRPADHTANGVTLGVDGWLYVAMGDFGFMEAEGTDGTKLQFRSGGVIRVRPDGTGLQVFSRGTRNIVEVAVDPWLNGFTRDNTNDGDGWDIRLHHFTGLEHHGYPSLYKRFKDEHVAPLADYGGGSGCGAAFIDEPGLPDGCSPALYTADWGRNWIYRHRLTSNGATFKPDQTEFASLTRVTDLDVDGSSRIYAASWKGATFVYEGEKVGYLVQLTPHGYKAPPLPRYREVPVAELVAELLSPSHRRRMAAQRELIARHDDSSRAPLNALARDGKAPLVSRIAATFAIALAWPQDASKELNQIAGDETMLPFALRALGDTEEAASPQTLDSIVRGIASSSPRAKLEAAVAAGHLRATLCAPDIAKLLGDADPLIRHTAVKSLVALEAVSPSLAIIDDSSTNQVARARALQVLGELHQENVVDALIMRLQKANDRALRLELVSTLARLYFREGAWKGDSWGTRPDTTGPYYQPEKWEATAKIEAALKETISKAPSEEAAQLLTSVDRMRITLDGAMAQLLAAASKDIKQVPAVLDALVSAETIPTPAWKLLKRAAEAKEIPVERRVEATRYWLRTNDPTDWQQAFAAVAKLADKATPETQLALRRALLKSEILGPHVDWLAKVAERNDAEGVWATACLLATTSPQRGAAPEVVAVAQPALDKLQSSSQGRERMLAALKMSNQREFYSLVLKTTAMNDGSGKEARALVSEWDLADDASSGPSVKSQSAESLIAASRDLTGKKGHGEAIFATLQCTKCHTVDKSEPLRGPYLPNVAKTYKREQLAEAILLPSKTLAQGFVTYNFALEDGRQLTGFVIKESPSEVVVRDNQGREHKIPTAEIEERTKSTTSVMPDGLAEKLTTAEFGHLLAYLESLAAFADEKPQ